MPRQARKQSSTNLYHVMIRGLNREYVFQTNEQKQTLMNLLETEQLQARIQLIAWCIMDNHVHLLVRSQLADLSKAIKIISLKYAAYYNKKTNRTGPVFGDRYKSENIEDDHYLLGVMRYIHNNPVKAKIVLQMADYTWSSYQGYLNQQNTLVMNQQKAYIMELFQRNQAAFVEFHQQPDGADYLETKEDREKQKLEAAQQIIERIFIGNGIKSASELKNKPEYLEKLIISLKEETSLTLRQIADLTGQSLNVIVKTINQK